MRQGSYYLTVTSVVSFLFFAVGVIVFDLIVYFVLFCVLFIIIIIIVLFFGFYFVVYHWFEFVV